MGVKKPPRQYRELGRGEGSKIGGMSVQSKVVLYGESGTGLCLHLIQPFLENISRGECNNGSSRFILIFDGSHRKKTNPFP